MYINPTINERQGSITYISGLYQEPIFVCQKVGNVISVYCRKSELGVYVGQLEPFEASRRQQLVHR